MEEREENCELNVPKRSKEKKCKREDMKDLDGGKFALGSGTLEIMFKMLGNY